MEGLTFFLFALCAILLYKLLRQRKALRQLTQQTDRFLEGGEALSVSLKEDDLAALQNSLSRLQNRLLLSQEQTRLEAKRSTRLLTDISHQLKTPLSSLRLFVEMDSGDHLESCWTSCKLWSAPCCGWSGSAPTATLFNSLHRISGTLWRPAGHPWSPCTRKYP